MTAQVSAVEPTQPVPARWVASFSLATVGVYAGWFGPLQILLAKQSELFAPDRKEAALGLVAGIGAVVSMIANPLWGALSDRTTSRLGRRIPWIAAGMVGGVGGLAVLSQAGSLGTVVLGWCLVQLALNASLAGLTAAVPDQVPVSRRGVAGGYFGVATILGIVLGTLLAKDRPIATGYWLCAAAVVAGTLPYLLLRRDVVMASRPPWSWRVFGSAFWISPRAHPDFGWAWLTRFLLNLANSVVLLYLLFFLRDAVHLSDADGGVLVLTAVNALAMLVTVVAAGIWSDRLGRRKVFVIGSGLIMAVSAFLLAGWQTWPVAVVAAVVLGVGFGVYTSVDFALVTQVLPEAADRAKDLGVINIAAALPQVMAPVVAAPLVAHLGGYPVLYLVAGGLCLAGGLLVNRIRSVA